LSEQERKRWIESRRRQLEWEERLRNPPNDEELAKVILPALKGEEIDREAWDLVTIYLHVSPERWEQLKPSVELSVQQLAKQADSLEGLCEHLRVTREEILRKTLTTKDRGTDEFSALLDAAANFAQAEIALKVRHAERLELRGRHLERVRKLEQRAAEGAKSGTHTKVDQLRATAARISAEIALHSERYPEALPGRLDALITHLEAARVDYERILRKRIARVPGGEQERLAVAATSLAVARAELESARGNHAKALFYQRVAWVAAQKAAGAVDAAYSAGTLRLDTVIRAKQHLFEIRLSLLDLERRYGDPTCPDSTDSGLDQ
jgi:hypothetical protein